LKLPDFTDLRKKEKTLYDTKRESLQNINAQHGTTSSRGRMISRINTTSLYNYTIQFACCIYK